MAIPLDAGHETSMNEIDPLITSSIADKIFLCALEHKDVTDRDAYLRSSCGTDTALLDTVMSMLNDHAAASEYFQRTAQQLCQPGEILLEDDMDDGAMIGPYRIVGMLGEGGCGRVYEAEQVTPIIRRVAIKILKLGMDTQAVIRRFEAERQTLSIMDHPNISHVFDAGATATGRPYFVMELVHGMRITDYCEINHMPIDERLRLMCQVCAAVQHAHNKGVIHRDLKPSNILVTVVDGIAVPKVIDFGIAKATVDSAATTYCRTIQGQPMGTPAYMSPEQFDGATRDVDTRSDIYSLGVILYELVAGKAPFDNDELVRNGFAQMRLRIQKEVPQRPSSRNTYKHDRSRNELDWIVMKAIEKDRECRYSTAQALATDLESFLRNEPVKAHPPSRWYRLKKLLQRNRLASISIATAVIALAIGLTVSTFLYVRAHNAEREQRQLRVEAEERAHVTKAAIYIMQDNKAEADAEIRKMGGLLTVPSVEATNVFRALAIWSATNGDWETSANRWLAMARVSRFDNSDMTDKVTRDLLPIAPTLVMINDMERYHQFQNFLIERLGQTNYPFAAEHLLKLCLLTPASPALLSKLQHAATVAEKSLPEGEFTPEKEWMEAWCCLAVGMWYYRNGHAEETIQLCSRSLLRNDWEKSRIAQAHLVRSMARKATGDITGAVEDLDVARISVRQHLQQPLDQMQDGHFHDWLIASILLDEAERVVLEAR
jgi:eukaryotic-like serine/threonine-protein kinase